MEATVAAMESERAAGEVFHIGSSQEIRIEHLIKEVGSLLDYKGAYEVAPTFPGSVSRRCPDITKAKEVLGYVPKVDWRDGLLETVRWYQSYFLKSEDTRQDGFKPQTEFVSKA